MSRAKTGTITATREGKWRVRATVRGVRRTIGSYDTRDEAERELAAVLLIVSDELRDGVTLGEYGDAWLDRRERSGMYRDPASDRGRWQNHVHGTHLAKVALPAVKRRHVIAWLSDMGRKGLARQTVLNTMNVLRGVLAAAVDEEILKVSPIAGLSPPKQKRTDDAWTFLTVKEQATALAAMVPAERPVMAFAMWTGLRAGELASLRVADLSEGFVTVRYGTPPDLSTKAGKVRRIPLLHGAKDALATWDVRLRSKNGIVFPRVLGGFRDPDHIVRWEQWTPVSEAVGRNIRWHDLRHTCAASLLRGWWGRRWSMEEVCAMLGHASITTTERYAHLADDILGEAARATSIGRESVAAATAELGKIRMISERATLENRTRDLRFTKHLPNLEDTRSYPACDQLATKLLLAIAEGEPTALRLAVDLASAVLDVSPAKAVRRR